MITGDRAHRRRLRSQKAAFAVIRGLSLLTIAILAAIIGFILWKGLRYDNETRSTVLPWTEAAPDGLAIIVNGDSALRTIEYPVLLGAFTDEYIDWSKIDGEDGDLLPLAIDPTTPEGEAAERLIFGSKDVAAWGGLVTTLPDAAAVVAQVAATPGTIAVVPAAAVEGRKDVARAGLRRLSVAANASALALVDNRQVEALGDGQLAGLLDGKTEDWSAVGGPDLPVIPLAPPPHSRLAAVLAEAGLGVAVEGGSVPPGEDGDEAPGVAAYLETLATSPGAVGYAFAEDLAAYAARGSAEPTADQVFVDAGAGDAAYAIGMAALVRHGRDRGWNLTPSYFVEAPRLSGRVGGISTIILNTLWMLLLTVLLAAPLGVAAAVYLVEYAKQGPLVRILRLGTETLAGIPSIIFGLFGMLFFVNILHFGFGLLSGCLTLTLMILPTIVRTSEEALKSVPRSLREGSLALGASKLKTIARVVIPAAAPGILTGLILGVGRAVGETAALLFTMGSDYKAARGLFSSARVLSAHVYLLFAEGISFDRAFSTATVLIFVVLAFNFAAKRLVGRMGRNVA
jgi:phosphate transport system permease protein